MGLSVSSIFLVDAITHETPTITQSTIDCCLESDTQALFGQLLLNGVMFSWGTHIYTQDQVDYPSGKKAGTKVGPDQLGPPVQVGSTRTNSDRIKKK